MPTPADLVAALSGWPGLSLHPHRFGGTEFRLGTAEIGHVHPDGTVDIPFPRPLREALVKQGAEPHHVLPESGWTTYRLRRHGLDAATRALRLSYLRQRTRHDPDPDLAQELAATRASFGLDSA